MRTSQWSALRNLRLPKRALVLLLLCAGTAIPGRAQTFTSLLSFVYTNGANPYDGLVQASDGNFYGTTQGGSSGNCMQGCGTVFKITSTGALDTLYNFCLVLPCSQGSQPDAGLIQLSDGNFYGATYKDGLGFGTIFTMTPGGNLTTLHFFVGNDGAYPYATLVQGSDGNLYGTTVGDHSTTYGTVFRITTTGVLTTLHFFLNGDGSAPMGALVLGADGNLYGTTSSGGTGGHGTVFTIPPGGGGLTTLYNFIGGDGSSPNGLVLGADGNFYGTTGNGGSGDDGTVFRITPTGHLTTLHLFNGADGSNPRAALVQASDGNFYGTTANGGNVNLGTIFEITSTGTLITRHNFNGTDGAHPYGMLIESSDRSLYGTTTAGGIDQDGTVFKLSLPALIPTTTVLATAPNPSQIGQNVTLTATVRAQNGSMPTGTVVFTSNGVQIGSASLNNSGVAVLNYSGLAGGTDSLVAMYQGSGALAPSTSNTVTQMVLPDVTVTSVTSAPNPAIFGQPVTITATVSPAGPPPPTGTVSFASNGTAIAGCTAVALSSQMAVCVTSSLAVGTDAILATYSGDSNYAGSIGTLSQLVNPVPTPLQFVSVTPCRLVDTRQTQPIQGNSSQSFPLPQLGGCNIPSFAAGYSLNVTVVPQGPLGFLTIWPTGEGQPLVSTMNSPDGRVKANAAIVPAGTSGAVSVYVTDTTDVILDIDGYFQSPQSGTLEFYPQTPCRVVDTRVGSMLTGGLGPPSFAAMESRELPIPSSACFQNLPNHPVAYSFNVTVVPNPAGTRLNYLTIWPSDQTQPTVSTLNNPTATVVANAAIVPAAANGDVKVFTYNSTDVIIDTNGYFAAPGQGGYSFYPVAPCRAYDSRNNGGQPFSGERTVNIIDSPCAPPGTAKAYVFNATVVPTGSLGYLTLWPDGQTQPVVSTLNAADGVTASNMAIVTSLDGSIDAYAAGLTQLILDISGYFAP